MSPIGYPELIIIGLIILMLLSIPFWIWMLVDCISNEPAEGNDRLIWVIVIALVGAIGAFVYFIARRPVRKKLYGR